LDLPIINPIVNFNHFAIKQRRDVPELVMLDGVDLVQSDEQPRCGQKLSHLYPTHHLDLQLWGTKPC